MNASTFQMLTAIMAWIFLAGAAPVLMSATVPARRKMAFLPKLIGALQNTSFSAQVESTTTTPIVVERAMYWNSSQHSNELGHASIAIPIE